MYLLVIIQFSIKWDFYLTNNLRCEVENGEILKPFNEWDFNMIYHPFYLPKLKGIMKFNGSYFTIPWIVLVYQENYLLLVGEDVAQLVRALVSAQRTWVRFLALANLVNFSLWWTLRVKIGVTLDANH